jgi:hypothetical protein
VKVKSEVVLVEAVEDAAVVEEVDEEEGEVNVAVVIVRKINGCL